MANKSILDLDYAKYDFKDPEKFVFKSEKGLSRQTVEQISDMKKEPEWMKKFRLRAYEHFLQRPMPTWGGNLSHIDFNDIYYYLRPTDKVEKSWDDVPEKIKKTFDRLGIPEAEKKFLAGVGAQYESEVVYHSLLKHLEDKGVIFCDTDTALKLHPEIVKDRKSTRLNSSHLVISYAVFCLKKKKDTDIVRKLHTIPTLREPSGDAFTEIAMLQDLLNAVQAHLAPISSDTGDAVVVVSTAV